VARRRLSLGTGYFQEIFKEVGIAMRNSVYLFLVLMGLSFFSCSNEQPEGTETLAKINNYNLACSEFEEKLSQELNYDPDLKKTREVKLAFLEQLIQEEVLIQEAKKLKLDEKEKFIRAIELYWKSTLIRDLLELKGKEINETVSVPQAEIDAYYEELKEEGGTVPALAEIQDIIVKEVKEKRTCRLLKEWMTNLEKKADIKINEKLL
jgi:hypothetical protein